MWNDLLVLVFIIKVRRVGDHGNDPINGSIRMLSIGTAP